MKIICLLIIGFCFQGCATSQDIKDLRAEIGRMQNSRVIQNYELQQKLNEIYSKQK